MIFNKYATYENSGVSLHMSIEKSLTKFPFNLSAQDVAWVRKTRDGMSTAQKIRQLFLHISIGYNVDELIATQPAGYMPVENPDLQKMWETSHRLLSSSEIPPFLAQDLEGGGNHRSGLTHMPNQLAFAAVKDMKACEAALDVMAREASSLGFNWSFTPCVDINADMQSAIVGTRSYGSDPKLIAKHAKLHIDVLRRNGIACAAKHWPGEGFDARDQHLVTTINPLSMSEWQNTFGKLYAGLIKSGILSIMSAHIALPAFARKHRVPDGLARYAPASLSSLLNQKLLREEMGFNGLIVSDATPMAGLTAVSSRAEHVPEVIENGCDIFLFCTNVQQDIAYMEQGLKSGALSEQRLEDAVTRILGMKAALGLHTKSLSDRLKPLDELREMVANPVHAAASQAIADKSVTLVKDTKNLLPLNPAKHKRITWIGRPMPGFLPGMPQTPMQALRDGLVNRGFDVNDFDPQNPPTPQSTDCVLYVLPVESSLGKSRIFLDWMNEQPGLMNLMNRYWHDLPTVIISFGHPYYLYDAPRAPCLINAYSSTAESQIAVLERLTGNAPFEGVSPVDPFKGAPDSRY
jgi:beta-N-acetylhexosaminidase